MIEVDLRSPDRESGEYVTVASMRVADGRVQLSSRGELFDQGVAVIDRRTGQRVRFADDPEAWARNLDGIYRAGELVPVVVADSHPNPPARRAGASGIRIPDTAPAPAAR